MIVELCTGASKNIFKLLGAGKDNVLLLSLPLVSN